MNDHDCCGVEQGCSVCTGILIADYEDQTGCWWAPNEPIPRYCGVCGWLYTKGDYHTCSAPEATQEAAQNI